ncbi:MAG: bacteriohemerythrin [Treponema sp.]|jgi:hemerythrin|nr:bacteriohemerythrin [Treponema sp.]
MEETENYVEWQDSYSVGIPVVDEQHKELIKLTNNLYKACVDGDDTARTYFKEVIRKTVEYVKFHFSAEEQIMSNAKYPQVAEHKRQHENFVKKVIEDTKKFEEGKAVPYVFVNYLKNWILNHIAVADKAYSSYILQHRKGTS